MEAEQYMYRVRSKVEHRETVSHICLVVVSQLPVPSPRRCCLALRKSRVVNSAAAASKVERFPSLALMTERLLEPSLCETDGPVIFFAEYIVLRGAGVSEPGF